MKLAIIHDHLTQDGGAERVAKTIQDIYPDSPTFTLVYNKNNTDPAFAQKKIITSFIQDLPFGARAYEWYLMLMPSATEHFNLNKYDTILSSTSFSAKGVITHPDAIHICYCHTPTRFLWTDSHQYLQEMRHNYLIKKLLPLVLPRLRMWDKIAAERVNHFIANSKEVQKRIKKYYNRDSEVIYPPVDTKSHKIATDIGNYFLAGGRMVGYKRFDILVNAFNRLGLPLKIFGIGPLYDKLRERAHANIEFIGKIGEETKRELMSRCLAFLNPQIEDFGITAVEAMASGRPVIAYRAGGALETVKEGISGEFFNEQTWEDLADKVVRFNQRKYQPEQIKKSVEQFDTKIFAEKIKRFVEEKVKNG